MRELWIKVQKWLSKENVILGIWIGLALISGALAYAKGGHNNYLIFKYMFSHTWNQLPLYVEYPSEYFDRTHYGPLFSLVIMPFALLPDIVGLLFFQLASIFALYYALKALNLHKWQFVAIAWIVINQLYGALITTQFNIIATALFILAYALVRNKKDFWAGLPILAGAFIKLYGIVGLCFFLFSGNKKKFITGCVVWAIVLFVLPMFISSPSFVVESYQDWFNALLIKNDKNLGSNELYQNYSIMGFVEHGFEIEQLSSLPFLIAGALLFMLPFLNVKAYKNHNFQLLTLCSALIFPILFSSSAELSTYIIIYAGIGIWFVSHPKPFSIWVITLLTLAIISSLSTTDLVPKIVRNFVRVHRIPALPVFIIWLSIIFEMIVMKPSIKENTYD